MKKEFELIRSALEEHLSSINENTSEIQALFDYLHQLEKKIDSVSSRLDSLQLHKEVKTISPLTQTEKKVFLIFYTEEAPISYNEIAEKTNLSLTIIQESIASLIEKGIPFIRSTFNDHVFLQLKPEFKERQAKENIINLSLQSFLEP